MADDLREDEHEITYRWAHPDLFRADCTCTWSRAAPDQDVVYAAVDEHEAAESDGIDWAEVARIDRDQRDEEARALAALAAADNTEEGR